jgi:hypothetical protein
VEIKVEWPESYRAPRIKFRRACAVHDYTRLRFCRHSHTMIYATRICSGMPGSNSSELGLKTVQVPRAAARSRFTAQFETHAIEVLPLARN